MKVDFKSKKGTYKPEFVKEIIKSRKDIKEGKGIKIATKDLWK